MAYRDRENRVFYITHSGELLIWLIIVLFIIGFTSHSYMTTQKTDNDYHIYLPDVDGLIVGSPVRMMGIEVGHVTKIKPTHDEVYVKFLIKDNNIKIPQGTQVTVEFSGMAGSKSLELYLPDETTYIDESVPILTANPPKRLHDAVGLLNDMFTRIGNMITSSSIFGKKLKSISMPQKSEQQDINEFLRYTNEIIDTQTERMQNMEQKINKQRKNKNEK